MAYASAGAAAAWPGSAWALADESAADLILTDANLITQDPTRPKAEAIAMKRGLILAVGRNEDVLRRAHETD